MMCFVHDCAKVQRDNGKVVWWECPRCQSIVDAIECATDAPAERPAAGTPAAFRYVLDHELGELRESVMFRSDGDGHWIYLLIDEVESLRAALAEATAAIITVLYDPRVELPTDIKRALSAATAATRKGT